MTITTEDNIAGPYAGDGSTTAYATPYFQKNEDIRAILVTNATGAETVLTLTTHYSLAGALIEAGGTLTMVTPPAVGETLYITVDPAQTQLAIIAASNPTTQALDKLTQHVQALQLGVDRSLKVSESSRLAGAVNTSLLGGTTLSSSALRFGTTGAPEVKPDAGPVLDASFTYSPTTHAGQYLLFDVDSDPVEMMLPDVSTVGNGHNFWVLVNSSLNLASITVATAGQLRSQNGYAAHNKQADRIYIGLATAHQLSAWVHVARVSNHWRVWGLLRQNSTDDLSYSTGGGGGGGSGAVDSVVGQTGDVSTSQIASALNAFGNTNLLTDAQVAKLTGVEDSATADQTGSEIVSLINTELGGTGWQSAGGGGTFTIQEEGSAVGSSFDTINFVGAGSTASDAGSGVANIAVPGASSTGGLYAGWEVIQSGLSAAQFATDFAAAFSTAQANSTGILLLGGTHDASSLTPIVHTGNAVPIYGESMVDTVVELGGTAKSFTDAFLTTTGNVDIRRLTFQNGGIVVSIPNTLSNKINDIRIDEVTTVNAGALLRFSGQNLNVGSSFGRIWIRHCEGYNMNGFIHMLCGNPTSATGHVARPDTFLVENCFVDGIQAYGITCLATDATNGGSYPAGYNGSATVRDCTVKNGLGADASLVVSYAINLGAARNVTIKDNVVESMQRGSLVRFEGIYNKAHNAQIVGNRVIDCGDSQSSGGGSISLKGSALSNVAERVYCADNHVELRDISGQTASYLNGIWIQCANAIVDNNTIKGDFGGSHIGCQSSTDHPNVRVTRNKIVTTGNNNQFGNPALDITGHFDRIVVEDNDVYMEGGNYHGIGLRTGAASGRTINDAVLQNNRCYNLSSGTGIAYRIENRSGATVTGIAQDNKNFGFPTNFSFIGGAVMTQVDNN